MQPVRNAETVRFLLWRIIAKSAGNISLKVEKKEFGSSSIQGQWQTSTTALSSARFVEMRILRMEPSTARSAELQFTTSAGITIPSGPVITSIPRMHASVKCAEARPFISCADCSRIGEKKKKTISALSRSPEEVRR